MIAFTASAAAMFTACPALCPSPCPGAPSICGWRYATPGVCDDFGMPSTSLPSAITGRPEPHRASHPLGMPAVPISISKPSRSRISVR